MYRYWTEEEINFLREKYKKTNINKIAKRLGRTPHAVIIKARKMNLGKPAKKRDCFRRGKDHPAYKEVNKPYESGGRMYIKPAANARPVYYSRFIWSQHYGAIPNGNIITFKDGNPMNCHISNLECISRSELVKRNHDNADKEMTNIHISMGVNGYSFVDMVLLAKI